MVITADEGLRGGRYVPLKANADEAILECPTVKDMIVVRRAGTGKVNMEPNRDAWWDEEMWRLISRISANPRRWMQKTALHPVYLRSRANPRACCTTADTCSITNLTSMDLRLHDEDIHSAPPISMGHRPQLHPVRPAFERRHIAHVRRHPDLSRSGQVLDIVDKHQVNIFYTAPTAIRALMKEGDTWPTKHGLSSLKVLGTVGEPINPEAWIGITSTSVTKTPIVDNLVADRD